MLTAGPAQAQQQSQESQQGCTAQLTPQEVAPGQSAVKLQAQLSQEVGAISSFMAANESGLALASPEDFAKENMSREEGEQPEPIQMAAQGNAAVVWLNTTSAEPGEHRVVLRGNSGKCAATLTVKESSGS